MTKPRLLKLSVLVLGAVLVWVSSKNQKSELADAIENFAGSWVTEIRVFALNSELMDESIDDDRTNQSASSAKFHGYPIFHQVILKDCSHTQQVVAALKQDLRASVSPYKCFEPHHGIRIVNGAMAMELLICYQCRLVKVVNGMDQSKQGEKSYFPISDLSQWVLDEILKWGN